MGKYGLSADQVLEWEVVTADGVLRVANKRVNSDLYWALCGGGGGTYGVVTALTVKAHPDMAVVAGRLAFTNDGTVGMVERWYDALDTFHRMIPRYTDRGGFSINVYQSGTFLLDPFFLPGLSKSDAEEILRPLVEKLEKLELPYSLNVTEFSGYLQCFNELFDFNQVGVGQYGGRIIPRSTVQENRKEFNKVLRGIIDSGALVSGITGRPTREVAGNPNNAVLPAWRDSEISLVVVK